MVQYLNRTKSLFYQNSMDLQKSYFTVTINKRILIIGRDFCTSVAVSERSRKRERVRLREKKHAMGAFKTTIFGGGTKYCLTTTHILDWIIKFVNWQNERRKKAKALRGWWRK